MLYKLLLFSLFTTVITSFNIPNKIILLGSKNSGKENIANRLSKFTRIPYYNIDYIYKNKILDSSDKFNYEINFMYNLLDYAGPYIASIGDNYNINEMELKKIIQKLNNSGTLIINIDNNNNNNIIKKEILYKALSKNNYKYKENPNYFISWLFQNFT